MRRAGGGGGRGGERHLSFLSRQPLLFKIEAAKQCEGAGDTGDTEQSGAAREGERPSMAAEEDGALAETVSKERDETRDEEPRPQDEREGGRKGVRLPRWSAEEEASLRILVGAEGPNDWASKAQRLSLSLSLSYVRSANAVQQYYLTMVKKDELEAATGSRLLVRGINGAIATGNKRRRSSDDADERQRSAPQQLDAQQPSVPLPAPALGRGTPDDCRAYLRAMGRSTVGNSRELTLRMQEVQRWAQAVHRATAGNRAQERDQRPLVAVTGAGGYLGGHVIEQLVAQNFRVRGTVRSLETLRDDETTRRLREIHTLFPTVELFACDLLGGAANFAAAFEGVSYVIHTACPHQTRAKNPTLELFRPAVDGVKAVIAAARSAGVKRVVMTSSCGAVQSNRVPTPREHQWSEKDWNDDSSRRVAPYRYAKAYAERTAWKLADGHTGSDGIDLAPVDMVSICPAMILGPPIYRARKTQGLSVRYLTAILEGKFRTGVPGGPCFGIVDVRDVAAAHIKAMVGDDDLCENDTADGREESSAEVETGATEAAGGDEQPAEAAEPMAGQGSTEVAAETETAGDEPRSSGGGCALETRSEPAGGTDRKRYLLSSDEGVTAMEIVDCLNDSEKFIEKHSWVCGCMPDASLIGTSYRPRYNVTTAVEELGVALRPWQETVVEMADAIVELGIVKPPLSARMQYAKPHLLDSPDLLDSRLSLLDGSSASMASSADRVVKVERAAGSDRRTGGSASGKAASKAGAGKAGDGSGGGRVTYFWTQEEMDKLCQIVQEEGLGNWERKAWLLGTNRSAGSVEQYAAQPTAARDAINTLSCLASNLLWSLLWRCALQEVLRHHSRRRHPSVPSQCRRRPVWDGWDRQWGRRQARQVVGERDGCAGFHRPGAGARRLGSEGGGPRHRQECGCSRAEVLRHHAGGGTHATQQCEWSGGRDQVRPGSLRWRETELTEYPR